MSSKHHREKVSPVRRSFYLFGLILCSTYLFTLIPMAAIHESAKDSLRNAQAVQRNKDYIINELSTVAWRIREHRILPVKYGGGAGDIHSFRLEDVVGGSANATYEMAWEENDAVIMAQSIPYNDATVRVWISESGRISGWSYTGRFQ